MELNQNHHDLPVFASFLIASYLAVDEERVLEAFHMSQQSRNGDLAKAGTLTLG